MKGRSQAYMLPRSLRPRRTYPDEQSAPGAERWKASILAAQDLANQVKYSVDYQEACSAAQVPTGRYISPSFGEWFSGRVSFEGGFETPRFSSRVDLP